MQKNIRTDFGFKTINIGSITIYTGKIRIKDDASYLQHHLRGIENHLEHLRFIERHSKDWKPYTTISFETTNAKLNAQLIRAIMQMMCKIAHERIDAKYLMHTLEIKETDVESLINY